jgi:hypothetical protein
MAPLFPVNNVWNIAVDGLSPSRALDVTNDHAGHNFHPDFGTTFTGTGILNGIPINFVAGDSVTPRLVNVGAYYQESDVLSGGTNQSGYAPIPTGVLIENGPSTDPAWSSGADHHICLVDTDNNILHELYSAIEEMDGSISTSWYGRWDLSTNDLRHDYWTSGDAAGLPVAPGLVRYDEVQAALAIDATGATVDLGHALRFTLDLTHGPHLWPARHDADSGGTSNPPFGMRVRLKSTFSTSGYSPTNKVIINTLKKYGAFMADNGGDWFFQGTPNAGWDPSDLSLLTVIVPATDMEVVDIANWQVFADSAEADINGNGLPAFQYPRSNKLLAIDFNDAGAPVTASGWTGFSIDAYNASPGYGWVSTSGLDYRTRSGTDTFWRDFVLGDDSTHTFRYDVANGQYVVTVFLGDPENLHNEDLVIVTNGVTQETIPYTVTGERLIQSYLVTVSGGYLSIGFTVASGGFLCIAGLEIDPVPSLTLTHAGSGLDETYTIVSTGEFKLVFDAGDNWGCSERYDLVNDPDCERNLCGPGFGVDGSDVTVSQPGLINQVHYSSTPNDTLTYTRSAKYYFPSSPRSFTIVENTPTRIRVKSVGVPMISSTGTDTSLTATIQYAIYPDGRIYITASTTAATTDALAPWFVMSMGLQNPGGLGTSPPDITGGWVRATQGQNPYTYDAIVEPYLFAYWDPTTPPPNTNFAKASILLVRKTDNPVTDETRLIHSWNNWVRWGYKTEAYTISSGQTVTSRYLVQLGTEGSLFLPDIKTAAVADPIATAFQTADDPNDDTTSGDPAGIPTGSFGYKLVMG